MYRNIFCTSVYSIFCLYFGWTFNKRFFLSFCLGCNGRMAETTDKRVPLSYFVFRVKKSIMIYSTLEIVFPPTYLCPAIRTSANSSNKYQNHMNMYVFSLTMFNGNTHSESCFCIEPDGPYLWNVHLVILGNMNTIGSTRSSWCSVDMVNTRRPYVMNSPSKNRFIQ